MDLDLQFINDFGQHLVNDLYIFSKFCLMYSLLLFYTILDYLK